MVVDDDGSESELVGVTRIDWSVGGSSVATARLEIDGVELGVAGVSVGLTGEPPDDELVARLGEDARQYGARHAIVKAWLAGRASR